MAELSEIQRDLSFVRQAVQRDQSMRNGYGAVYYVWAAYTLIGYVLIDFAPQWAGWFFLIGWLPAGMISGILHQRLASRWGEFNADLRRRVGLHWGVGSVLIIISVLVLANLRIVSPQGAGQTCVVFFGLLYFLAGVHFDRSFLWLGPILIAGGLVVGFIPHFPWTALGIVIAAGLVGAGFINQRAFNRERKIQAGE